MLSGYKAKRITSEGDSEIRTKGDPGAKSLKARYSQAIPAIFNFLSCSERISYSILVYINEVAASYIPVQPSD